MLFSDWLLFLCDVFAFNNHHFGQSRHWSKHWTGSSLASDVYQRSLVSVVPVDYLSCISKEPNENKEHKINTNNLEANQSHSSQPKDIIEPQPKTSCTISSRRTIEENPNS